MNRPIRLRLEALHNRVTPSAGSLDPSFGGDGIVTGSTSGYAADRVEHVLVQPDGKIVAVGQSGFNSQQSPFVFRFNADGTPDATFAVAGLAFLAVPGGSGNFLSAALQPDGKIVAVGTARVDFHDQVVVVRLTPDGAPDRTFDGDGFAFGASGANADFAHAVALQPDGKIVAGGRSHLSANGTTVMTAMRFTAAGALDPTFDGDGIAHAAFNSHNPSADAVLVQPDGKVILAGTSSPTGGLPGFALARLTPDGALDPTFDGDGLVRTAPAGFAGPGIRDAVLQPDGKIVAAGGAGIGPFSKPTVVLLRYNADGSPDPTFDGDGMVLTDLLFNGGVADAVAVQSDGKVVAAGLLSVPGGSKSIVARYTAAGQLDPTFGPAGQTVMPGVVVTDTAPRDNDGYRAVAVQPDGKIVAGGVAGGGSIQRAAVVRYRASDAPETGADEYRVNEDAVLTVADPGVLANDAYVGPPPAVTVARGPAHGTLNLRPAGGFTYTPAANFNGTDSFEYRFADGRAGPATVTLTVMPVGDTPVAVADEYGVAEDAVLTVPGPGVRDNDINVDAETPVIVVTRPPAHGTLDMSQTGGFTYTPAADYAGPDSFDYALDNGSRSAPATVTLTVADAPDAPVAVADAYDIPATGPLVVSAADGLLANDSDVDGDVLTAVLVTPPAVGLLDLNDDGSFTYTPPAGFFGEVTFQYKATDGELDSEVQTVTLTRGPLIKVEGSTLIVVGTAGADALTLRPTRQWGTGRILVTVELRTPAGLVRRTVVPAGGVLQFSLISVNMGGGNDAMNGTAMNRPFRVVGGAGNDTLRTGSAADVIFGDDGADVIYAGAGNDVVFGGGGADTLRGDAGNDLLAGGLGADAVNGGAGNDMLFDGTVAVSTPATDTLQKVLARYVPSRPSTLIEITQRLVVTPDDVAADILTGGLGVDWHWTVGDLDVTDRAVAEPLNAVV